MKHELKSHSFGHTLGKGFNIYFNNFLFFVLVAVIFTAVYFGLQYIQLYFLVQNGAGQRQSSWHGPHD